MDYFIGIYIYIGRNKSPVANQESRQLPMAQFRRCFEPRKSREVSTSRHVAIRWSDRLHHAPARWTRGAEMAESRLCSWENQRKIKGKPWENNGKTMGKPWEKPWKTPWEMEVFDLGLELDICEAQFGDAKEVNKAQTWWFSRHVGGGERNFALQVCTFASWSWRGRDAVWCDDELAGLIPARTRIQFRQGNVFKSVDMCTEGRQYETVITALEDWWTALATCVLQPVPGHAGFRHT